MATVNGTNYAKAIDPSSANILGPGIWGGRVRAQVDTYTFASTAAGTVVRMGKLPAGARVLGTVLQNAALASSTTLAVGNGGSGQGAIFAAAAASSSASSAVKFNNLVANTAYTVGTLSGDDVMTVTVAGATATGAISLTTLYVVD